LRKNRRGAKAEAGRQRGYREQREAMLAHSSSPDYEMRLVGFEFHFCTFCRHHPSVSFGWLRLIFVNARDVNRTRLMQTEFARLLPERLGPLVTVIGFAATTNRTSCFAIRDAHFGFGAGSCLGVVREKSWAPDLCERFLEW